MIKKIIFKLVEKRNIVSEVVFGILLLFMLSLSVTNYNGALAFHLTGFIVQFILWVYIIIQAAKDRS